MGNFKADDYTSLWRLYEDAIRRWSGALHIYLRCDPEVCAERIARRARTAEAGISAEYLRALHRRHEAVPLFQGHLYGDTKIVVIDCAAEDPPERVARAVADAVLWASS